MNIGDMQDLPGNSHKRKVEVEYEEVVSDEGDKIVAREKIITGGVIQKKVGLWSKFKSIFMGGDATSVGEFVLMDVIVPSIRDMIFAAGTQSLERAMYGDTTYRGSSPIHRPPGGRTTIRYDKPGASKYAPGPGPGNMRAMRQPMQAELDDIIFDNRIDAQMVLDDLTGLVNTYEFSTVADYKQFVGITPEHTDNRYGWNDNIYQARLQRTVGGGYRLRLPNPIPID